MSEEDSATDVLCQVKPESKEQPVLCFGGTKREMGQDPQVTLPVMSPPEVKPTEPTYWRTALNWLHWKYSI